MSPSVSLREATVLVQKRWEFGSMGRVRMSARKEAVWILLGTQYESQCESKKQDRFGPKEVGIWVHEKGLYECKEGGCVGPVGDAI